MIGGAFTEVVGRPRRRRAAADRHPRRAHGGGGPGLGDERERTGARLYSDKDTGTFTHMGTRTYVHVLLPAAGVMGHADHVAVVAGSTLWFAAP